MQERAVGFVFQHYALFRHMNVGRRGVRLARAQGGEGVAGTPGLKELLELVQMTHFAPPLSRISCRLASDGADQRSRGALAPRPQVLLLDEPFGALNAKVRQDLRRWLDELHRELGVTSLLVTHDQEEALELA